MLKPKNLVNNLYLLRTVIILMLVISFASCVPKSTTRNNIEGGSSTGPTNTTAYPEPTFPMDGIFIQEGGFQTKTAVTLPLNFNDSFLVRGLDLSKLLRKLPNTTQFCIVGKYNYIPGSDRFLVLSGKPKSYTDLINKTTEFYLHVEPNNDVANQNDCLNYNLSNTLYANASSPSLSFSLAQLCSNCTSGVTSGGLQLYYSNGEQVPNLILSQLLITISGANNGYNNSCVESTACKARGYDCCLEGQCVKDLAMRPSALGDPAFASVLEDVTNNPDRRVLYPQFYFVCPTRPDGGGSSGGSGGGGDPNYEAAVRLMELGHLYQCINQVDGEFSYCTVKFTEAESRIPGNFSASESGFLDDVTFSTLNTNFAADTYRKENVVKIYYGGMTLFDATAAVPVPLAPADGVILAGNDDLISAQTVTINKSLPANAIDDNLYITYKIDGTCEKVSSSLARCSKKYIQSYSDTKSTYWHNSSKSYQLPSYANTTYSVIVKVSGIVVPEDASTTWSLNTSTKTVNFVGSYSIYANQEVEITYYSTNVAALTATKNAAKEQVKSMCLCGANPYCNLSPMYNDQNQLVNYECVYSSENQTDPPVNQTVYVSNKNIPHRYFDANGVSYDESYATALDQEGLAFTYINSDLLKPNNIYSDATTSSLNRYIGFNEIYGSFTKSGNQTAKPAKRVRVKKDTYYDINVNSGAFSSCPTCGTDYYTSIQKIFPNNFSAIGGGYSPDHYETKRVGATSLYRSDDLLFGRACFLPATMIPWTHVTSPTVNTTQGQRLTRLAGQHFMFANGYNKDWYGFDYGSLLGSFDGVTWFSVGNSRRVKAKSNKLFLAVNAYFGDLNTDNSFNVSVTETVLGSSPIPEHDTQSDGAECQKSHYCSNDNDCYRQLGYDFTCQNVGNITTNWPIFDANANEVMGSASRSLVSIVGGNANQAKRCVYRGRGAPCHTNLVTPSNTFNGSALVGLLTCSQNNMCQSLSSGNNNRFNNKIARAANTPTAQNTNNTTLPASDLVAQGARIIGRPYDYYGSKTIPSGTNSSSTSLTNNLVAGVCIPGKNIASASTTYDLNTNSPSSTIDSSDKINGIGATMSGSLSAKYLNACPATDTLGYSAQSYNLSLGVAGSDLETMTTTQNMSSNLLNLPALVTAGVYSSTNGSKITSLGLQRNACLRAPGASCFTDLDCASSDFVASKVRSLDLSSVLNTAEEKFWEEDLVCGNPDFKYISIGTKNPDFDIKKNLCCREFGKTLTVYTETDTSTHHWCDTTSQTPKVAGVNVPINSTNRYSRVHTAYDKMTCNRSNISSTKKFALSIKADTDANRLTQILHQYKTLDTLNSRTCCTSHWVRSFDASNGGGHAWTQSKQQTINKSIFEPLNWLPNDLTAAENLEPFECEAGNQNYASCEIKNFTDAEVDKFLNFFGSLELLGIPQVAVPGIDDVEIAVNPRNSSPLVAQSAAAADTPVQNTVVAFDGSNHDFIDSNPKRLFSASNTAGFNIGSSALKKVFSESEFNCCIPSGQEVPTGTTAPQCCTGYVANQGASTILRCCLPDYTDVTLYLNRYVSSEGRGLPDTAYDEKTGYIKDPGVVEVMAQQKALCCSGTVARGVAIWKLFKPLEGGSYLPQMTNDNMTRRFVTRDDGVDNNTQTGSVGSIYDAGVRWNNHLYCVPANYVNP